MSRPIYLRVKSWPATRFTYEGDCFKCIYHTGQPMCESLLGWLDLFRWLGVEVTVGPGGAAPLTDRVFKHYRHSYSNIWGWPHSVHWLLLSSPGPWLHDSWGQDTRRHLIRFQMTHFLVKHGVINLTRRIRSSSHLYQRYRTVKTCGGLFPS